jgi:GT2 family glycosyltransferase
MDAARVARVEGSRVAVAIVNANSGPYLTRSLRALEEQTLPPERIVVVDNASTDGSADGLEDGYSGLKVIRLRENVGFAAANNVAAREAANYEWLALLNPDAFPEPRWLEELVHAAAERPEFSFFASRILKISKPERLDATGDLLHVSGVAWQRNHGAPASVAPPAGEVFSASAAAALYKRGAFLSVGGFDERFFCYYEDTDLGFRLRLAGHRCWYVPTAIVRHVGSATAGRESDFLLYHTHRNIVWMFAKDMPAPLLWLYLPQHLLINVLTLIAFGLRRRFRIAMRAKVDAVRGLPTVIRQRRSVQRRRVASARSIRAAMAQGLDVVPTLLRRSRDLRTADAKDPPG